jgi:hypothetical protein
LLSQYEHINTNERTDQPTPRNIQELHRAFPKMFTDLNFELVAEARLTEGQLLEKIIIILIYHHY